MWQQPSVLLTYRASNAVGASFLNPLECLAKANEVHRVPSQPLPPSQTRMRPGTSGRGRLTFRQRGLVASSAARPPHSAYSGGRSTSLHGTPESRRAARGFHDGQYYTPKPRSPARPLLPKGRGVLVQGGGRGRKDSDSTHSSPGISGQCSISA
jgi:hypothetical protein